LKHRSDIGIVAEPAVDDECLFIVSEGLVVAALTTVNRPDAVEEESDASVVAKAATDGEGLFIADDGLVVTACVVCGQALTIE
jgi:hypothetical protein